MTRILHVLDHSLPLHSGYSFRTRAIMKAQLAAGLDVAGVTSVRHDVRTRDELVPPQGETVDGLTFHRTTERIQGKFPKRELREVAALERSIERIAARWKPDLLHAHSPMLTGMAAQRVAPKLGIPVVYEIRAFWEDAAVGNGTGREGSPIYWLKRQLENRVVARADAVAVICDGLKTDLVRRGVPEAKITVAPNGVDMTLFGTAPAHDAGLAAQLGLAGREVIGFVGSFYDYEGLDDLIAAMPRLLALRPDAALLLVGGGPVEPQLRAAAAASSAASAIHFIGRVPHNEVERYYGLIDVMVYPRKAMRLTELVTPLKPLEAMAQGRLVAASDVGGHRELIVPGVTGSLFAPGKPDAIASSLAALLGDRGSWDARRAAARRFVETERDWTRNVDRYLNVYDRLLQRARSSDGANASALSDMARRAAF